VNALLYVLRAIHRFKRYWEPNDIPKDQIDWSQYLPEPGFHVLARRWMVERTFAWLLFNRGLSRDYERLYATSETWIYLAMRRLMQRMLVRMHQYIVQIDFDGDGMLMRSR
jgi:transposase